MTRKEFNFIHIPKNAGSSVKSLIDRGMLHNFNYTHHRYPEIYPDGRDVVIFRDPIDRFLSAFYYSKKCWPNPVNKMFLTVREMLQALIDPAHIRHEDALSFFGNRPENFSRRNMKNAEPHTVLGNRTRYIWTFEPQSTWIVRPPAFILSYKYLNEDFGDLAGRLGYTSKIELPSLNAGGKVREDLSRDERGFLFAMYESDYNLFEKLNIIDRITVYDTP